MPSIECVSAEGLFCMVQETIRTLGVVESDEENCSKLAAIGTDGASANIMSNG